jgi:predicted anti-sigma-YlaC factor YlaD
LLGLSSVADVPDIPTKLVGLWVAANAKSIFGLLAIAYLILAALAFLLARGYVRGLEWARRRGSIVAFFAIIFAVLSAIVFPNRADPGSPFWTIIFNVIVIIYLRSENVRRYFKAHTAASR